MPISVTVVWIPIIIWLLTYEAWAVIRSHGYTLSEAVWWCVGYFLVGSKWPYEGKRKHRIIPHSVKTALLIGWLPAVIWLCTYWIFKNDPWVGWNWLLFHSPYPWRFFCDYTIGILTGHFLWQRISTYSEIDKSEWLDYLAHVNKV